MEPFIPDINAYQSLGCIRIQDDDISANYSGSTIDTDVRELVPVGNPLRTELLKLKEAFWIQLERKAHLHLPGWSVLRIYVLPDDVGRARIDRSSKTLRKQQKTLLAYLDCSPATWNANFDPWGPSLKVEPEAGDGFSLFYLFNTLPSPSPTASRIKDKFTKDLLDSLMCFEKPLDGLKSTLLPFQRRSAAMMLEREVCPRLTLDPRLQRINAPDGSTFFIDSDKNEIFRHAREYDSVRGGILAETMGLGKTLICLTLITVTKDDPPKIPPEYSEGLVPVRKSVGSLLDTCAATIWRKSLPFKRLLKEHQLRSEKGDDIEYSACQKALDMNTGHYEIPSQEPIGIRRQTANLPGKKMCLSTCTIILTPPNLVQQWCDEIKKHCEEGQLTVIYGSNREKQLPSTRDLIKCHIWLCPRTLFEGEERRETVSREHRMAGFRNFEPYESPLKSIHWKRIIVDEGHSMGQAKTQAISFADKLTAECRWVVSGTPANGLIGVEVGMAAYQNNNGKVNESSQAKMKQTLNMRKYENAFAQEKKDLERIGVMATKFLKVRPWANPVDQDRASWSRFIPPRLAGSPGEPPIRTNSHCLRSTIESLIVKHRVEDVDADLVPLHNKLVYLEPSFYDTLSINLFVQAIVVNAVTSEREDSDYLFHPKNRNELNRLVNNLRQSGLFWTGFKKDDVEATMKNSREYLSKVDAKGNDKCSPEDRALLLDALKCGHSTVTDAGWASFSRFHELGLFVIEFPQEARRYWALDHRESDPLLIGATQLLTAQEHVNANLYASYPGVGLIEAGKAAMGKANEKAEESSANKSTKTSPEKASPASKKTTKTFVSPRSTRGRPNPDILPLNQEAKEQTTPQKKASGEKKTPLKSVIKEPKKSAIGLPEDHPLRKTAIAGVASSKLAYLLDRILELYQEEKILVFYEGEDVAYYVAEALELIGINHLIYASKLTPGRRAQYITTFNSTETFRVLLMDVHQASHGLSLSVASRVFFVNPVWQPNVEAQAIKRAHRIDQKRPVYVETLVLRNTLEDHMLQRRQKMTHGEHERTQRSLLDDRPMAAIIENLKFLPFNNGEEPPIEQKMARLATPQQVFGRVGWARAQGDEDLVAGPSNPTLDLARRKEKQRQLSVSKASEGENDSSRTQASSDIGNEPQKRKRSKKAVVFAVDDTDESDDAEALRGSSQSLPMTPDQSAFPVRKKARFPDEITPEEVQAPTPAESQSASDQLESSPSSVKRSLFGGGSSESSPLRPFPSVPHPKGQ
ncbi:MAG: ribosylnicotinamide kinase [Chaenotheca gracillima]|nr:MAG: ribosylnicotinamide kinase [Chaenotheca gracillima]